MFCTECGEENRNDRKFCANCGTKLKDYTKPVENPVYPEEILKEQEKVKKSRKASMWFNPILAVELVLAISFTIASFAVPGKLQQGFAVSCIVMFVVYLGTLIAKKAVKKKLKN